ncbi:hypothetical protein GCM10022225_27350 [Plantactinospora mayteni]|uniref:6-carboxy-5,6,7,8-tetrahydropterin synthase n=1 Tax=Plantactinospora mayteni TaxID=566021 RepID=A0ABQ4EIU2_9ACTN|nr:hypothetical protein Pma05_11080 [Plantactinospora mayteni]
MYSIGVIHRFDAAHLVSAVARGLHGHTFTAVTRLKADRLRAPGFVVDFGALKVIARYIDATLDHRNLNEVLGEMSAGRDVATHLLGWCRSNLELPDGVTLAGVVVSEGGTGWEDVPLTSWRRRFEAAHHLPGLGDAHKCSRVHGHTYQVFAIPDESPDVGTAFADEMLIPLDNYLKEGFNYRYLNEWFPVPPTSENLAQHLFAWCEEHLPKVRLAAVRVSETPSTWAEYRRKDLS